MKMLLPVIVLIAVTTVVAQQPDRWKGLIIDESTPEQAFATLGKPKSDKTERIFPLIGKWFGKSNMKEFRVLHYENVEGFPDVKLAFNQASKLVLIHLEPKKITAQAFVSSYPEVDFRFGNEVMSPADLKRPRNSDDRPVKLDAFYVLVGGTDKVLVFGGVGNALGSVASTMFGGMNRQEGRSVPGDVKIIQLVSRTLENREGSDLLK